MPTKKKRRPSPEDKPYHILYKMEHSGRGLFYIGIHSCDDPHDNYKGSGTKLKEEYKKNGYDGWEKKILKIFKTRGDAIIAERKVVTGKTLKEPGCLNQIPGGMVDGWKPPKKVARAEKYSPSLETRAKIGKASREYHAKKTSYPELTRTEEQKRTYSEVMKRRWADPESRVKLLTGRGYSVEHLLYIDTDADKAPK